MSAAAGAAAAGAIPPAGEGGEWDAHLDATLRQLAQIYADHVEPLENKFAYDVFRPSRFKENIVQKKPFVTFLGPFSAGKSTFINYLMQSNYLLTGPQPVTDKFTVIMHGDEITQVPGRVLIADSSQPFRGLNQFGDAFADCFQGLLAPHPILRSVSLIDTPGVLEAAGDIHSRRYDYVKICRWFIEKSDLVFFMFDPTKLDAGNELRMLFKHGLRGFESRTRIILNKADTVGPQELMRVYGSLFWNLSNLINTTEPPRVYVSSFWDQPYKPGTNHELFTDEKSDLLYDLTEVVPLQSLDKRVTTVLRRCQDVLIHCLVCATLRSKMPSFFGKDKALKAALDALPETFEELSAKHKLSVQDFPPPADYAAFFEKNSLFDMPDFEKCEKKQYFTNLRLVIETVLPSLLKPIKTTSTVDPRDRKHALMVQRQYQSQLADQLRGVRGTQGALGESATPAFRQTALPNAQLMVQQPQQYQAAPVMPTAGGVAAGMDPAQMQQMMAMMLAMQQQQQMQQQQSQPR